MRIAIIGTGYVGLVSGACLAHKGHTVVCVDNRPEIVKKINNKKCPIYEEGLDEILKKNVGKRLRATESIAEALNRAQVVIIAVGTPYTNGAIDLKGIEEVSMEIARCLRKIRRYMVIVIKSTVVPTTTGTLIVPLLERISGKKAGRDFGICMNPEFLREGSAIKDFLFPDRIVIGGIDARSCKIVETMYSGFDAPVILSNPTTAEMIKYTSSSLLATLISFANEIANICSQVGGIDVVDVMEGVHLDYRLNPKIKGKRINPDILTYIKPGCGFGGSCFPKDLKALISFSKKNNFNPVILESVIGVNEKQPFKVIQLLKQVYPDLRGLTIAVLGLSFKPGTDDIRESPALPIIKRLLEEGAKVKIYDPVVKNGLCDSVSEALHMSSWKEALNGADAVIVITKWKEFEKIGQNDLLKLMRQPVLIDARRMFKKDDFKKIKYIGIGYTEQVGMTRK